MTLDVEMATVDSGDPDALVAAGATEQGRDSFGSDAWVVLSDPAGNVFCIGGDRPQEG